MTWFEDMFGFKESGYERVKKNMKMEDGNLVSLVNGKSFDVGQFSTPSLGELREQVNLEAPVEPGTPVALEIVHFAVSDIYEEHFHPMNEGAMFQVASQFNCLEFISQAVVPENGVTGYASDNTQGPACSLACPGATVYRNYFATTPQGNVGQTAEDQINNLDDLEEFVDNDKKVYWRTRNGYTNSTSKNLSRFSKMCVAGTWDRKEMLSKVKIGLQIRPDAIRTYTTQKVVQKVSQAFCSGISISYSQAGQDDWSILARIVLDAAYECTLLATILNVARGLGTNIVILTFIGGGVFGNDMLFEHTPLRK